MLRTIARRIKSTIIETTEQKVLNRIKSLYESCKPYFGSQPVTSAKILWVTNFNLEPRRFAHDALLILSLRIRGAEIIPVICDQAQSTQCIYHLGKWQNSDSPDFAERRKKLCNECRLRDSTFWKILGLKPISIRELVDSDVRKSIAEKAQIILAKGWEKHITEEGFPLGMHVTRAILNGEMRGAITSDWKGQADSMAFHHIFNILILLEAYRIIFNDHKIDRVFGNGGYYYHWDTAFYTANAKNIPFYRAYPIGLRVFTWNYHRNNNELIDLASAWPAWKNKPLTDDMSREVDEHLLYRGIKLSADANRENYIANHTRFDLKKPIALILTGVIWDANTLHEGPVYSNMYEWLFDTLKWLEQYPDLQVIVRVHPADNVSANVTGTKAFSFRGEMERSDVSIPKNVHIIWPEESVETYELMDQAAVGICYSSTTGLEFCCLGKPMIVLGTPHYAKKGFTFEPQSRDEYIGMVLNHEILNTEDIKTQAYKYWYFYAFHASVDFGLLKPVKPASSWVKRGMSDFESDMKPIDYRSLMPGENKYLDYVCESIIHNEEITSENRWPPLCLDYK